MSKRNEKKRFKKKVGNRLFLFRTELGLSQRELVANLKIRAANYSRIEKGEIAPGIELLDDLYKNYRLSSDWLLFNHGDMFIVEKESVDFSRINKNRLELAALLFHIERVPLIKHKVLAFYLQYINQNHELLQEAEHGKR